MGKKGIGQDATPNVTAVANKDLMQRMNFLYQMASYLNQQHPLTGATQSTSSSGKEKRKRKGTLQDLATFHIRTMKTIGNKSMVKMDPSIKRTICKACQTVLLPGESSRVRIKRSKSHRFVQTQRCNSCGFTRRIPNPPQVREGEGIELADDGNLGKRARATDLSQRERSAMRPAPLFEQDGHVIYVSNETGRVPATPQGGEVMGGDI